MAELTEPDTIRDQVREKYAAAARAAAAGAAAPASCCGPTEVPLTDASGHAGLRRRALRRRRGGGAPRTRSAPRSGCGVPTAVADLHEGETVLDLGSGAGADVLISARRVGATGRAIGLDMTDEMLELARANAAQAGVTNAEFVKGHIEDIPLADASVDVVISNCVINLSGDKAAVLARGRARAAPRRALRGLRRHRRPGHGRGHARRHGAVDGLHRRRAHARASSRDVLAAAGLVDVEIRETHRVHEHAAAAIIRARKPAADAAGCCSSDALDDVLRAQPPRATAAASTSAARAGRLRVHASPAAA